jgi:hypothetical protein
VGVLWFIAYRDKESCRGNAVAFIVKKSPAVAGRVVDALSFGKIIHRRIPNQKAFLGYLAGCN